MGVALAPAGCATEAPPQAPAAPLPPPPPPAPTIIYVMVPAVPMPTSSTGGPWTPNAAPTPTPTPTPTSTQIQPPLPPVQPTPVAQSPDPYKGTPIHGQSCDPGLNAKGSVPACSVRPPPGPTCESIADTQTECPTM